MEARLRRRRAGIGAATLATLVLMGSGAADAGPVVNRLAGSVLSVSGAAQSALAALGVRDGAAATVEFEVESTATGTASSAGVSYLGAITGWRVEIGSFVAVLDPLRFNQVIVSNDAQSAPSLPKVDLYSAAGEMDTIDDVLGPFASVAMSLAEFGNRAIDDSAVDQDLSRFDTASISLAGPNGAISVLLGGKVPPPPPQPACVRSQLQSGAKLASHRFEIVVVGALLEGTLAHGVGAQRAQRLFAVVKLRHLVNVDHDGLDFRVMSGSQQAGRRASRYTEQPNLLGTTLLFQPVLHEGNGSQNIIQFAVGAPLQWFVAFLRIRLPMAPDIPSPPRDACGSRCSRRRARTLRDRSRLRGGG